MRALVHLRCDEANARSSGRFTVLGDEFLRGAGASSLFVQRQG